jgi:hypothetical protein
MRFTQRFSIRKTLEAPEFARGIWNPTTRAWRDVVEDYLRISRIRMNNKLSMFKLQLQLISDIVNNYGHIEQYRKVQEEIEEKKATGKNLSEQEQIDDRHIRSEIIGLEIINKALREVADGIVWRYFDYNRAILYLLADKQPIDPLVIDAGMIKTLHEFGEVFLEPDDFAIINDITNFLRVGDITRIKKDKTIELIEVKSTKKRGRRITRQKERMAELVEFFNTGMGEYDGKKMIIRESRVKQRNFLKTLHDSILKARKKGYDSVLIGNHLILDIADAEKVNDFDAMLNYFDNKHRSVKDKWSKDKDLVFGNFFINKLEYSRNYAPFSIFPYGDDICTDVMMGRLHIHFQINLSDFMRLFEKNGWNIIDCIFFKSEKELEKMRKEQIENISWLLVEKEGVHIHIPPVTFGRIQFELIHPRTMLEDLEEILKTDPDKSHELFLTNYLDEKSVWN